jgi:cytochrome c-type biogenesis protein CcsB
MRPLPLRSGLLTACLLVGSAAALAADADELPIQHNGRIKPFAAFARQSVKLIAGSERWRREDPSATLWRALSDPAAAASWKWIRADYPPLQEALGLDPAGRFYSVQELAPAQEALIKLVREAQEKRDADERPGKLHQKAELVYTRLLAAQALAAGEAAMIPSAGAWTSAPVQAGALAKAVLAGGAAAERAIGEWEARHGASLSALQRNRLSLEVFYLKAAPFRLAALLYILAFALLALRGARAPMKRAGVALAAAAFACHALGLGLRVAVLGRPPVSNMYESMVFMNWALMLFAFAFCAARREVTALVAGALVSALVMLYADLLPIDASLDVLVPVLRSNYWLSIHVMTVVSSYGAFGLAMGLGHRHLFLAVSGRLSAAERARSARLLDKVIQLGVVLIGTGTVLGGVWANESWGRFWGWDPKETWALITFLGYLIVVHLRFARRLGDDGLAVAAVLGFQLVLMTWYGVNFVLGRGLHSYGAGTGGMQWVIYFLSFEVLFLVYVFFQARLKRRV